MTVTVWAVPQFGKPVNVRLVGETVPSVGSLDESPIETEDVGDELSMTVNWAVPPLSVVVRPLVGMTVIPATDTIGISHTKSNGRT